MVLDHSIKTFKKNISLLVVFSLTFLFALLVPILAGTPTYNAMGGVYLRFLSIPGMSAIENLIIVISFLISNYLMSFGIVAINLIVKKERAQINIKKEIIDNIARTTTLLFGVFVALFIINAFLQIIIVEFKIPAIIGSLIYILLYLPFFYLGPAMVIDNFKPVQAFFTGINHMKKFPMRVVNWTVIGILSIFGTSVITFLVLPNQFQWLTILINSFIIIPFLLIYQSHNYIEKYNILITDKRGRNDV
jgi:hypothetical protein